MGIKPLYYFLSEGSLVFGSEIKALLADPEVQPEVAPEMIDRFLTFLYIPGEETLLKNICKLAPGCYLMVEGGRVQIREYWDLKFCPTPRPQGEIERELLDLLEESVGLHMISDVPVGFLLSGGVDSTAMLSFAVGKTKWPLSSYTLGFANPGLIDERPYAELASRAIRYRASRNDDYVQRVCRLPSEVRMAHGGASLRTTSGRPLLCVSPS